MDETKDQKMGRLIDELLLDLLENGREVVAKDGSIVRVKASPSDIREARARLKEIAGSGNVNVAGNNAASQLMRNAMLRFKGRDLPVDEELVVEAA